ncbi:MAG: alpha-N-acetylglucosaminidase [Niabella sp.]|nr:alpha-N-acetylglucosaminidase [Niabella sp.]
MPRKYLLTVLLFFWCSMASFATTPEQAAYGLIKRMAPQIAGHFSVEAIGREGAKDVFEIASADGKIVLRGNNAVAIASAFHWYLKYYCNVQFSWNGRQLHYPGTLPVVKQTLRKTIQPDYRVYMNYCTFSYSAAWWNWERWQWEIDYMAMNGINMPLAAVGLEGVWYNSLLKIGLTDKEARTFLVGPAYFAWQWMTNIESFGGPLPKSWIDAHIVLGKKIIDREVELGMQPIQQGFSGFVPRLFMQKFPGAKIKRTNGWAQSFSGVAQLDPLDPLFQKFGRIFLEEQRRLFGAQGYYAADPFHEGAPPQTDEAYLRSVGEQINKLFMDFDAHSRWVMQAWSIRKPIATAVPKERLLILDLNGGRHKGLEGFWGYDFVVGNLHNFGGRINMHGDLQWVAANQYQQVRKNYPNAVGYGLFMEGIAQNPVYYDLAFEMPFHSSSVALDNWLQHYAARRYGGRNKDIDTAWQLLLNGPYRRGTNGVEASSILAARPALDVKKSGPNAGFNIPYPPLTLQKVLALMLKEQHRFSGSDAHLFDVVDIERQLLSNLGQKMTKAAAGAFKAKDQAGFQKHSTRFLTLMSDVDRLVSTRPEYSFHKWVSDARSWGKTPEEKALYDWNASMLVTQWGGDRGDSLYGIFDYSWREWGGLIRGYYKPRWQLFYNMLQKHLKDGTEYSEAGLPQVHGRETMRANAFYSALTDWENKWIATGKRPLPVTKGQELKTVNALFKKYRRLLEEYEAD